jgi:hypothetical protein
MDEEGFREFLLAKKKPKDTTESYIKRVKVFDDFLTEKKQNSDFSTVSREDLILFAFEWCKEKKINSYQFLWGLEFYYAYLGDKNRCRMVKEIKELVQLAKQRIQSITEIKTSDVKKLNKVGLRSIKDLLDRGKTQAERDEIAEKTDLSPSLVLEFVKLANLARIGGLKKKRARLVYDTGFDTTDKIAKESVESLINKVDLFIEKTGYEGRGFSQSEAEHTIEMAKFMDQIIEY